MPPKRKLNHEDALAHRLDELTEQLGNVVTLLQAQVVANQGLTPGPQSHAKRGQQTHRTVPHASSSDDEVKMDNPFAPWVNPRDINTRKWEDGFKLDLPEFTGSLKPDEFLDWLISVEEVLEFKQVPAKCCVPLEATRFCGRAASWWH
ncbi:hypothetical protein ACS0TY_013759 [Phlomoides rotata]